MTRSDSHSKDEAFEMLKCRSPLNSKNQFGRWHRYQTKQNQADAYRVAQRRAESTKKRHRLVDDAGILLDILTP